MKVVGHLPNITKNRDSKNQDIEIHVDQVEYLTSKKDGRYYQDFEYIDVLDTPLVITGDCLSLRTDKKLDEGEFQYHVFEKEGERYERLEKHLLWLTMTYDFDENVSILSEVTYSITLPGDAFRELKKTKEREKMAQKGKGKRR